jgi:hypothetical protein
VVNQAHGFHRFGIVQRGRHGTFSGAGFATIVVAMQKNIIRAGMAEDIDARIARYLFRAVAPEDDFLMQIKHADADLQAIEDVAIDLRIFKVRHGAAANWLLLCPSAGKLCDLRNNGHGNHNSGNSGDSA